MGKILFIYAILVLNPTICLSATEFNRLFDKSFQIILLRIVVHKSHNPTMVPPTRLDRWKAVYRSSWCFVSHPQNWLWMRKYHSWRHGDKTQHIPRQIWQNTLVIYAGGKQEKDQCLSTDVHHLWKLDQKEFHKLKKNIDIIQRPSFLWDDLC